MKRTVRRHRARIAAVLGLACTIGVLATPASAARGDKLTTVVNGRRLRLRNKTVCAGYNTAVVPIAGGTKFHHLGQVLRAFAIACDVDLTTALPVSPSICTIGYTETGTSLRHATSRAWGSTSTPDNPVLQVTISSFGGGRVRGTFSGTLAGETAGTPATTARGTFSVTAVLNGNNCTPV